MSASLSMHDFETSCTSHLKNISSLNYKDLPNINTFHYSISKMNAKYPQLTKCQHFLKKDKVRIPDFSFALVCHMAWLNTH